MGLLLFFAALAVGISFTCSLLESVILSVTKTYIAVKVKEGKKYAFILSELKDQIDRPLAAILSLNTIANTVGATGVGAQVVHVYGDAYLAFASGLLTFIILIFSEIVPKTLGANYWKSFAPACAYLIRLLIVIAFPFVWISELISHVLSGKRQSEVTREEIVATAEIGATSGSIEQKESLIITNLLRLDQVKVSDIMTPRSVIMAIDAKKTIEQVIKQHRPIRFSRIPVYEDNLDHVIGMVHRYKLLEASSHDLHDTKVRDFVQDIHRVPESISVAASLDQFIKRKEHQFLVVDEYGTVAGLVTLEDAIETLLGVEIVDEFDSVVDMRKYAREMWRERKQKLHPRTQE